MNAAVKAFVDVETFDRLGAGKWRGEKLMRIKNTCFMGTKAMKVVNRYFTILTFVLELHVFSSPHNFPSLITGVANTMVTNCSSIQRKVSEVIEFCDRIWDGISVDQLLNSALWLCKILKGTQLIFHMKWRERAKKKGRSQRQETYKVQLVQLYFANKINQNKQKKNRGFHKNKENKRWPLNIFLKKGKEQAVFRRELKCS